jgi:hypothetical protein
LDVTFGCFVICNLQRSLAAIAISDDVFLETARRARAPFRHAVMTERQRQAFSALGVGGEGISWLSPLFSLHLVFYFCHSFVIRSALNGSSSCIPALQKSAIFVALTPE